MRIRTSLGALTLGAALLISAGSVFSSASAGETWDRAYTFNGISAYVREYGDVIKVCDTAANSFAATMDVHSYAGGGKFYTIKVTGGNGTCVTHRASDGGVYDLPENVTITSGLWGEARVMNGGGTWVNDQDSTT